MIYIILKSIKQAPIIVVYNLKYLIEKSTLTKFGNDEKDLLDDMSSNYFIIFYKWECHADYVRHIFRVLLSVPNSTFNILIERNKYDWYKWREVPSGEIIHNAI